MNKFLLLISGLIFSLISQAQNKTFGIGVTTPNPNAALHVESPTNNQGFMMPRITTAQRNAMSASLSTNENGLLVYDSDLKTIFIWNTNFWSLPYKTKFLITDPNSTDSALTAKTYSNQPHGYAISAINKGNGDVAGFFLVDNPANNFASIYGEHRGNGSSGFFLNNNPNNPSTTLMAISPSIVSNTAAIAGTMSGNNSLTSSVYGYHSGAGAAGGFVVDNATNNQTSLWATTNGTGSAGAFNITNAADTYPALYAATTGTGAAIAGETSTGYAAVQGRQSNATGIHNAFQGLHDGAGQGHAGLFQLTNAANNYPAIQAETAGAGPGIRVFQGATSLGGGIDVQLQNPSTLSTGVNVNQLGTASAGSFTINNTSATSPTIFATTNGSLNNFNGPAILATTGTAGSAIIGRATGGASNGISGISDPTTDVGSYAVLGQNNGLGVAGVFTINNSANSSTALVSTTNGTSSAGYLAITNAANDHSSLYATTNGTGSAILGISTGSGNSIAGLFQTTDPANNYPAVQAVVAGNNANGIYVNHQGTGGNLIVLTNNDVAAARVDKAGVGYFNGGAVTGGADLAEMFDVEGLRNDYEPGDVLVISEATDRTVEKSSEPNSTKVAGVYATKPGVTLTEKGIDENKDQLVPMGVIGVIPTKVCLENGAIKRGDLLVTSSTRGHAMKAIPVIVNGVSIYPTGAVLGKALENFNGTGTGLIKVLVNVK